MKDQLITILEAVRLAQDNLEVEGHTQATLEALRSLLCNEDVTNALRLLSHDQCIPSRVPQAELPLVWRDHRRAA